MPKLARELSAMEVSRLRAQGAHAVGGVPGLYLQNVGASRAWVLRYVIGTRRRRMGLGSYPAVTLAQARDKARAEQLVVERGDDPIEARATQRRQASTKRDQAITFKTACERFIAAREAEWRNAKHRQQWENTLATYAEPVMGHLDVSEIGQDEVLKVLDPIWRTKTETASRLRGRVEQILDWATVRGHRKGENPARWKGHMDKLLPKPGKIAKVVHHAAVPVGQASAIVERIHRAKGTAANALLLQVLTATRSGEVRGALWAEFDLKLRVWNVPEMRMKAGKPHRVSLSRQAIKLLKGLPRVADCELVFPSLRNTPLSDMALLAVMRRLKVDAVPHGFRSTFRDWAAEHTAYPRDLVEMALAHAIEDKVEAAYRRGDMLAKRAALMQDWADYCMPPSAV